MVGANLSGGEGAVPEGDGEERGPAWVREDHLGAVAAVSQAAGDVFLADPVVCDAREGCHFDEGVAFEADDPQGLGQMGPVDIGRLDHAVAVEIGDGHRCQPAEALADPARGGLQPLRPIGGEAGAPAGVAFDDHHLEGPVAIEIGEPGRGILEDPGLGELDPERAVAFGLDDERTIFDRVAEGRRGGSGWWARRSGRR